MSTNQNTPKRDIGLADTAKIIRETLKVAFPHTKFSVRSKSYSMGCSIDARWTNGPTERQVKAILDRFEGKGFDGMTDCSYYCGERMYKGELVDFCGAYVHGSRSISLDIMRKVADRIAYECGVATPKVTEYGCAGGPMVPFTWHSFWHKDEVGNEIPLTMAEIEGDGFILAHDSHKTESLSNLISHIAHCLSLETAQPVELPEYIDKDATVGTGRASFEEPMKMFEGHTGVIQ